ncbi:MAG TPA: tyrosinase family protein [Pirellulaceae bacterium]|nr:tyrosinase family protein [Pirellulaceae bacterium]
MVDDSSRSVHPSRREFLYAGGTAALAVSLGASSTPALAENRASYVRMSLSDRKAAETLQNYREAVAVMLKLPPTDPRNWYRIAFIHLLDCPHGNWWFLPWHRGYLGWFEEACRELIGVESFALPYWDWTAELVSNGGQYLTIPPSFANPNSELHPSNPAFIASFEAFRDQFSKPVADFYASLSQDQLKELGKRAISTPDEFWKQSTDLFFPIGQARQSNFDVPMLNSVGLTTILTSLAATHFVGDESVAGFGSGKAESHHEVTEQDILESEPHNNAHNAVGGFMRDFLSPVDPLFFMHHANIDRLWDVWTRKQNARSLPSLPEGSDLATWQQEPFLFFIDGKGKPLPNGKAGDYAHMSQFGYTYQPGSGEQVVQQDALPRLAEEKSFKAALPANMLSLVDAPTATVSIPVALTHPEEGSAGPPLYARITIQPPHNRGGLRFHVLVNSQEEVRSVNFNDPSYAGTFSFFGSHSHDQGHGAMAKPVIFTVALTAAVNELRAAGALKAGEPLRIRIVPDTEGVTLRSFEVRLESIYIGTF